MKREENQVWLGKRMDIRLYDVKDGITKLGPGLRFGIWTQGCTRHCRGCMTPDSQPLDKGYLMDVEELASKIILSGRTEITVSGGEPFLQAKQLTKLIEMIRKKIDLGVIIYTGFTYEELVQSSNDDILKLLDKCDLLVDGAYDESLNDGKNLRGSSNQRATPLTERYKEFSREYGTKPAEVEFFFQEEKVSMVGVPSAEVLERFKNTIF